MATPVLFALFGIDPILLFSGQIGFHFTEEKSLKRKEYGPKGGLIKFNLF